MWCQTGRGLRTSPVFFLCAAWMPRAGYFRHEQGKEWKGRSEGGQANPTTTPTWTHAATAMTRAKEVNLHMRFLHPLTLNFPHSPPLQPLFQLYFCKSLPNFLLDDMFALCLMYVLNYRIFPGSCKTACNNVLNSEISPSLPPCKDELYMTQLSLYSSSASSILPDFLVFSFSSCSPPSPRLSCFFLCFPPSFLHLFCQDNIQGKFVTKKQAMQKYTEDQAFQPSVLCVCVLFWGTYWKYIKARLKFYKSIVW